uniref:Uncharacterized protein n=1 Tax=Marinobacter nauticus TaxID=2743 RepID=A0A455W5Q2_MARNT|nr:hypothetical protein YBY_25630 [Marinobacter nauticus]
MASNDFSGSHKPIIKLVESSKVSGKVFGVGFPKISKAMDGLREAHMDVLVAVFGKPTPKAFMLISGE